MTTVTVTKEEMGDLLANFAACYFSDMHTYYGTKASDKDILTAGMVACGTIKEFDVAAAIEENKEFRKGITKGDSVLSNDELLKKIRDVVDSLIAKK